MKKNKFIKSFYLISFMFYVVIYGGEAVININHQTGKFDLILENKILLSQIYPKIFTPTKVYSVENNTLKVRLKSSYEPTEGIDKTGKFKVWHLEYYNGSSNIFMEIFLQQYNGLSSVAIGYKYYAKERLLPEGGTSLVIGKIPHFEKGLGAERFSQYWTRPTFINSPDECPSETQFLLWDDKNFEYVTMIPLVGGGMKSTFMTSEGKLQLVQSSFDVKFKPEEVPVVAIAWGKNPFEIIHTVYRCGMNFMGNPGKLRVDKPYPDIFDYIGWCSWNTYYSNVSEEKVLKNALSFKDNKFPIKFFLIDDGWQDVGEEEETRKLRKLHSFGMNKEKFPSGMKDLIKKLKEEYGIRWVGFWHTFQGYWNGIEKNSQLGKKYKDSLLESLLDFSVPHPLKKKGHKFFNDYHKQIREAGGDFVKVDNQSSITQYTVNKIPISFAAKGWQENLQSSVMANFNGSIINCMCMAIENIYFWKDSNVSRSSDDYYPMRPDCFQIHALHNVYNSLWYSELAYPDFDMFESHHPQAIPHSVLRAISGGPVYISDAAGDENWELLWKLIFSDGKIPRPDVPLKPTKDMLFIDPSVGKTILKSFTFVGKVGIVGVFNVNTHLQIVSGKFSPSDVEGIEGSNFVVYEHFSRQLKLMEKNDSFQVNLKNNDTKLYLVIPIKDSFAEIGALDKYISPKWVELINRFSDRIEIGLKEGCEFGAYSNKLPKKIDVNGKKINREKWTYENNLLTVNLREINKPILMRLFF